MSYVPLSQMMTFAGAVVAFRNDAFETAVVDRMIFRQHGETFFCRIRDSDLWESPTSEARLPFPDGNRNEDGWRGVSE